MYVCSLALATSVLLRMTLYKKQDLGGLAFDYAPRPPKTPNDLRVVSGLSRPPLQLASWPAYTIERDLGESVSPPVKKL